MNATHYERLAVGLMLVAGGVMVGCDHSTPASNAEVGSISLAMMASDIGGVQYNVTSADGATNETRYIAYRAVGTTSSADAFFTLPVGTYQVAATIMSGPGAPLAGCPTVSGNAVVLKGRTTEILLTSRCSSGDTGAIDVDVTANFAPDINSITFDPSKVISTCESVTITVAATDRDGDPLTYRFKVLSSPTGAVFRIDSSGDHAVLRSNGPGDFLLDAAACDARGCTDLQFPVHVLARADGSSCDITCDDNNPCTTDTLGGDGVCTYKPGADGTSCSDGVFCNGEETCRAGTCTPGVAVACGSGLTCTEGGCANVDECAAGTSDCSPNADCTDRNPATDGVPFDCRCRAGYEGDGHTCTAICDPVIVASGIERCVRARPDGTVDLRLTRTDPFPWTQQYTQSDEPDVNECGPTAAKNFLYWYGLDAPYPALASEMRTNTWDTAAVFAAVFAAGPLVGCVDPIFSCPTIAALVSGALVKAGTLPGDLQASLNGRAPAGYVACIKDGDSSRENFRAALAEGNPVVYLESQGGNNLHWAVATGIYDLGADTYVRVANSDDRPWDQFADGWSLAPVGDGTLRGLLSTLFGLRSYTMIRWIPAGQAAGGHCP